MGAKSAPIAASKAIAANSRSRTKNPAKAGFFYGLSINRLFLVLSKQLKAGALRKTKGWMIDGIKCHKSLILKKV
jgi:hypothetical protein